jgi:hypothetical protein
MPLMSPPYVTSAKFTGGKMTFSVLVDNFEANEYVEISGYATQTYGAFANIYKIALVPPNVPPAQASVDVTVDPGPEKQFRKDQDVTVFVRVAKVWVTVLGEHNSGPQTEVTDQGANDGTTWDVVRQVSEMYGPSSPPTTY